MEDCLIFGASKAGALAFENIQSDRRLLGFVDNDSERQGKRFFGKSVFSLYDAKSRFGLDLRVIIASSWFREIEIQLRDEGFSNIDNWYLNYYGEGQISRWEKEKAGAQIRLAQEKPERIPPIFLITLPKSASSYLASTFPERLGISGFPYAAGGPWPESSLNYRLVEKGAIEGTFLNHHIFPTRYNLTVLARFYDRIWIHVRDPRQSVLSHTHNVYSWKAKGEDGYIDIEALPENYWDWNLEARLDYHIERTLPELVSFIEAWLAVAEDEGNGLSVLFTQYEQFVYDRCAFYQSVLDFWGIPKERFDFERDIRVTDGHLFRKGQADEWREEFSSEQKEKANAMIPFERLERFGWKL